MKILHIITSLGDGGAEHTLYKICRYDNNNKHIVISLKGSEKYFSLLKKLGISVYCLNMNYFSVHKFFLLIRLILNLKPNLVQTWLVHADLIGGIAARISGVKNIIWNIRYSNFEIGKTKLTTILILKILAKLSFVIPRYIVIVSKRAKKIYTIKGYDEKKLKFIPNGYDLSLLKIDKLKKKKFLKQNKIKNNLILIGNVARYDLQKDHLNLLNALSIIKSKNKNFACLLIGTNIKGNEKLINEIKKLKLNNYVKLLSRNNNISQVMNGLDIHVQSSSYGEGFPNVIAEAMACGTPCVVTNVGDAALIVGKTGWVVSPNNSIKLAKVIEKAIYEKNKKKWNKICNNARLRIQQNYEVSKMVQSYNRLWKKVF